MFDTRSGWLLCPTPILLIEIVIWLIIFRKECCVDVSACFRFRPTAGRKNASISVQVVNTLIKAIFNLWQEFVETLHDSLQAEIDQTFKWRPFLMLLALQLLILRGAVDVGLIVGCHIDDNKGGTHSHRLDHSDLKILIKIRLTWIYFIDCGRLVYLLELTPVKLINCILDHNYILVHLMRDGRAAVLHFLVHLHALFVADSLALNLVLMSHPFIVDLTTTDGRMFLYR